jgi:hypothetical protein
MKPTVRPGARVWFRALGEHVVRRGDVLIYAERPGLVVHRVVARPGGSFRTKGDGRALFDSRLVPREAVLGRVVAVDRPHGTYSLEGGGARAYATGFSLLSLLVGLAGRLTSLADRAVRRLTGGPRERRPFSITLAWCAQAVMTGIDAALFRLCHAKVPPPEDQASDVGGEAAVE